jgi:hypothetical protein
LVVEAIENYLHDHPDGEDVTLAVLQAIGRQRLQAFAKDRTFDRVKQDVGLLVAQTLVDLFGAIRVHTLRREDRKGSSARRNTWTQLPWVNSYALHRVRPAASHSERILLDTSVVRKIVHGDADALDVGALLALKDNHPVSIADGALAELADHSFEDRRATGRSESPRLMRSSTRTSPLHQGVRNSPRCGVLIHRLASTSARLAPTTGPRGCTCAT